MDMVHKAGVKGDF